MCNKSNNIREPLHTHACTVPVKKKLKYLVTGSLVVRSRVGRGSVGERGTVRFGALRA